MTETEKILTVKAMVGDSDSDETLAIYLRLAGQKIINRAFPYEPFDPLHLAYSACMRQSHIVMWNTFSVLLPHRGHTETLY